jgi:hypothetical protein
MRCRHRLRVEAWLKTSGVYLRSDSTMAIRVRPGQLCGLRASCSTPGTGNRLREAGARLLPRMVGPV